MLVRYPPSEIHAELLLNTSMPGPCQVHARSMRLFRIYGLPAFNCVSSFRQDAPLNAAQNVPLNAAQGVGRNVAQDGGQNAAQVDGQNALQTVSAISARRTGGSTNCALECWCIRRRIWGEYSCPDRLMYIYVVMNCGRGFAGVHFVGWIVQAEKLGLGRGLRMLVWVQIVLNCGRVFRRSRTINPRLSSNCFELWARFSPVKDYESLFEFKLFWTVGEIFAGRGVWILVWVQIVLSCGQDFAGVLNL